MNSANWYEPATGRMMPVKDHLITATALTHGLTVATRHEADFFQAGVRLVNPFTSPWSASSAWTAHLTPTPP